MMNRFSKLIIVGFIIILNQSVFPGRGPSQPEAAKFEPIDATDLVSLYTGNFTYNLPLLEVMGPEGGFPINIFYHAGIGPNTEASWVGLGWDLNAGSINRFVNGYPDDYYGGNIFSEYFASQKGKGISFGVSYGPVGMNITYDCYTMKTGVNASLNVVKAIELVTGTDYGIGAIGATGLYLRADATLHIGTSGVGMSAGLNVGFISEVGGDYNPSIGVSTAMIGNSTSTSYNFSASDFSISSDKGGTSLSTAVGFGFQNQAQVSGKGWLNSSSSYATIPIGMFFNLPISVNFGSYEWEWIVWEMNNENAIGSLHQAAYTGNNQLSDIWGTTSDNKINSAVLYSECLSNAATQQTSTVEIDLPKIDRNLIPFSDGNIGNIILTAEDNYQVGTQGLAGNFKPYFKWASKYYDQDAQWSTGKYATDNGHENLGSQIRFRFNDEKGGNFMSSSGSELSINDDYGSRIVKPAFDMDRGILLGFEITAEDGIIYEFYQPVISYYSQSTKNSTSNNSESETIMSTPYATSWLLTGIKGPDYIDRTQNGFSADDWGYWIKLRYITSSTFVPWRTPHSGSSGSIDPVYKDYETHSEGLREDVYLESIETATHIARFHKSSDRLDDKNPAIDNPLFAAYKWTGDGSVTISFPFDKSKFGTVAISNVSLRIYKGFGYQPRNINLSSYTDTPGDNKFEIVVNNLSNNATDGFIDGINIELNPIPANTFPESSQKLEQITMHKKVLDASFKTNYTASYATDVIEGSAFDYDYELMKGAPNSEVGKGKLTLKAVKKLGKNGAESLVPPTEFVYGYNPDWSEHTWDIWGGYTFEGTQYYHMNSMKKSIADRDAGAWCLNKIISPTGGVTTIEYESDYIDKIGGDTENKLALFTPWFYESYHQVQPSGYYNFLKIDSPTQASWCATITHQGSPFSLLKDIYDSYSNYFSANMPVAVSYFRDTKNDNPDVGKQNSQVMIGYDESENKINFAEILNFRYYPDQYFGLIMYDEYGNVTTSYGQINYDCDYFPYLFAVSPNFMFGGGNRIKSVSVSDISTTKKTNYKYGKGYLTIMPSLATTSVDRYRRSGLFTTPYSGGTIKRYEHALTNYNFNILGPSPMVGYDKVEVIETDGNDNVLNGKSVHEFVTSEEKPFVYPVPPTTTGIIDIEDESNLQGKLKSVSIFGLKDGTTGQSEDDYYVIQRSSFEYMNGTDIYHSPVSKKVYKDAGTQEFGLLGFGQRLFESQYINKPLYTIHIEDEAVFVDFCQTNTFLYDDEYNQTCSLTVANHNIGFIAQTGGVGISQTYTSTGEKVVTENLPAFWFYPDMKSRNMLTQNGETKSYRLPSSTNFFDLKTANTHNNYLVSADVTTWKNWSSNEELWRINDTYKWIGETSSFQEFNLWTTDDPGDKVLSNNWQRTSNITAYDRYAHPIEELALDGEYATSIYSYSEALPVAVISNARRSLTDIGSEASFIGFESGTNQYPINNDFWGLYTNDFYSSDSHSGDYSFKILGGNPSYGPTRDFLPPTQESQYRKYKFSFWVKTESGFTSGQLIMHSKANSSVNTVYPNIPEAIKSVNITDTQGKWVYVEGILDLGLIHNSGYEGETLRIRCYPVNNTTGKYMLVDDIRFAPVDATMMTYSYDKTTWKLTSITDQNNISSFFEYDNAGRLVAIKNDDRKIVSAYEYKHARSN